MPFKEELNVTKKVQRLAILCHKEKTAAGGKILDKAPIWCSVICVMNQALSLQELEQKN